MGKGRTWADVPEPVRTAHEAGHVVIPRPSRGKRWRAWGDYLDDPPGKKQIVAWHDEDPDAMWQLLCGLLGGIGVLDFDVKHGKRGAETLARLGLTPTLRTPSGGAHVWVRLPETHVVRSRARLNGFLDVELLADRHLATFYGQRDDGVYRFTAQPKIYRTDELPSDLQEYFSKEKQEQPASPVDVDIPEGFKDFVPRGELLKQALRRVQNGHGRHDTGVWLGMRLCDERVPHGTALKVMFRYADHVQDIKEGDLFTRHEAYSILQWCAAQPARPPERLQMLAYHDTDGGNAARLVALHGEDLRYCAPERGWYTWDGTRWARDTTLEVERRAKALVGRMFGDVSHLAVMTNASVSFGGPRRVTQERAMKRWLTWREANLASRSFPTS
jgi:hypothetical protein